MAELYAAIGYCMCETSDPAPPAKLSDDVIGRLLGFEELLQTSSMCAKPPLSRSR